MTDKIQKYFKQINAFLFTALWYFFLFVAWKKMGMLALIPTLPWIALHCYFSPYGKRESLFLLANFLLGISLEWLGSQTLYRYEASGVSLFMGIPIWVICLWSIFILSLLHSWTYFHKKRLASFFIGLAAGVFPYQFAEKGELLHFLEPLPYTRIILSLVWGILFLFYMKVSVKFMEEYPIRVRDDRTDQSS